jgi:hypothetical protein
MKELTNQFSTTSFMDAMVIYYPQYWLQLNCGNFLFSFGIHKNLLCSWLHTQIYYLFPYFSFGLDIQVNMFKILMKVNFPPAMEPPFSINLFMHLLSTFLFFSILKNHILDYFKLVWNCHSAQVLIFVEHTKTFSTLSFMKNKLWN